MNTFEELINNFNTVTASSNERLLYDAVCSLISVADKQAGELKRLDFDKEDRESWEG